MIEKEVAIILFVSDTKGYHRRLGRGSEAGVSEVSCSRLDDGAMIPCDVDAGDGAN